MVFLLTKKTADIKVSTNKRLGIQRVIKTKSTTDLTETENRESDAAVEREHPLPSHHAQETNAHFTVNTQLWSQPPPNFLSMREARALKIGVCAGSFLSGQALLLNIYSKIVQQYQTYSEKSFVQFN